MMVVGKRGALDKSALSAPMLEGSTHPVPGADIARPSSQTSSRHLRLSFAVATHLQLACFRYHHNVLFLISLRPP